MQKVEFEELVERPVSEEDYKVIEMVYQWQPSISDRKQIQGKCIVALEV